MKLSETRIEELRMVVEENVSDLISYSIEELGDNSTREKIIDSLPSDWTEDEIDIFRHRFCEVENEGGIDNTLYVDFVRDITNSFMKKYEV
jgi:hypothetical protein